MASSCGSGTPPPALPGPTATSNQGDKHPSARDELMHAIQHQDVNRVGRAVNRIISDGFERDDVEALRNAWMQRTQSPEPRVRGFLMRPDVSAYLAAGLAQVDAADLGAPTDPDTMSALRIGVQSRDPSVQRAALRGLAVQAEDSDVDLIARVAAEGSPSVTRVALAALATTCSDKAIARYNALLAGSNNEVVDREGLAILESSMPGRDLRCGSRG